LDELQDDVDTWLISYNNERSHSGKHCFEKTPMQTFIDSIYIAKEKNIGNIERISDNLLLTYQAA
jgi:hypothetical protein